jgi:hypothetical protein
MVLSTQAFFFYSASATNQMYTGDTPGPSSGFSIPAAMKFFCASQTRAEMSLCAESKRQLFLRHVLNITCTYDFQFRGLFADFSCPKTG